MGTPASLRPLLHCSPLPVLGAEHCHSMPSPSLPRFPHMQGGDEHAGSTGSLRSRQRCARALGQSSPQSSVPVTTWVEKAPWASPGSAPPGGSGEVGWAVECYGSTAASPAPQVSSHRPGVPQVSLPGGPPLSCRVPTGDSWGIFAFLCAALCNLPAVPALNGTEELGAGQSIQKTYDLTRYLEHQLRTLAGTYVSSTPLPLPFKLLVPPARGASSIPRAQHWEVGGSTPVCTRLRVSTLAGGQGNASSDKGSGRGSRPVPEALDSGPGTGCEHLHTPVIPPPPPLPACQLHQPRWRFLCLCPDVPPLAAADPAVGMVRVELLSPHCSRALAELPWVPHLPGGGGQVGDVGADTWNVDIWRTGDLHDAQGRDELGDVATRGRMGTR